MIIETLKNELEGLKANKIIKDFVEGEAYTRIASDIVKLDPSRVCTTQAARHLVHNGNNPDIKKRFEDYVLMGYAAVISVKYQQ